MGALAGGFDGKVYPDEGVAAVAHAADLGQLGGSQDSGVGVLADGLVCWLMERGIMPLYTPLGGSWLNMAESVQHILTRRALSGEHPHSSGEIIAWLEATARAWNRQPTPFVWGGARHARRERARRRRHGRTLTLHPIAGSGACFAEPVVYAKAA